MVEVLLFPLPNPSMDDAEFVSSDGPSSSYFSYLLHHEQDEKEVTSTNAPSILSLNFNQNFQRFSVGTDKGFFIYDCSGDKHPVVEVYRRAFDKGISAVEMLFGCRCYALLGGGSHPNYPPNKVMVWDDKVERCIRELGFKSFEVVISGSNSFVLVCPGLTKGQARVENYDVSSSSLNITNTPTKLFFISAHNSAIACCTLSMDGKLLATASTKGTLVRVFNTMDGTLLREFRRGADRAEIYSLAFSPSPAQWLGLSSDKGTVHVFSLKVIESSSSQCRAELPDIHLPVLSSPSLSFIKGMLLPKYFSSEWSISQFRNLIEGVQYIIAFGVKENTIVILGKDGSFYRCQFDPVDGGEMTLLDCLNFFCPKEETF
ncbi:hypothetical protein IFM89_009884 [Coptis chinensis]|uniref:Uncharacterized protein n=1 Tax=Coptis chinensis TaxID=261450 RepID=A0A835I3M6_9MAGN|nr:hypothetical protein IFM89_009884 [Coptis chinensis]